MTKSAALTEAHRKEEFNSEVSNVDSYIKEVETNIKETETVTNLTSVKAQYTKHKVNISLTFCSCYRHGYIAHPDVAFMRILHCHF